MRLVDRQYRNLRVLAWFVTRFTRHGRSWMRDGVGGKMPPFPGDAAACDAVARIVSDNWPGHLPRPLFTTRYRIAYEVVRWYRDSWYREGGPRYERP